MKPKRIQRRRTKGWRMPPNTIYVGRGSIWGNPFIVYPMKTNLPFLPYDWRILGRGTIYYSETVAILESINCYKKYIKRKIKSGAVDISKLEGKNLACWCPVTKLCHADVLLQLANKD